jgi:hypothetical protein
LPFSAGQALKSTLPDVFAGYRRQMYFADVFADVFD